MVYLPEVMPASFQAIYTPVESAGTEAQIKHLARLMATQMTAAGLGPGEWHAEPTETRDWPWASCFLLPGQALPHGGAGESHMRF